MHAPKPNRGLTSYCKADLAEGFEDVRWRGPTKNRFGWVVFYSVLRKLFPTRGFLFPNHFGAEFFVFLRKQMIMQTDRHSDTETTVVSFCLRWYMIIADTTIVNLHTKLSCGRFPFLGYFKQVVSTITPRSTQVLDFELPEPTKEHRLFLERGFDMWLTVISARVSEKWSIGISINL